MKELNELMRLVRRDWWIPQGIDIPGFDPRFEQIPLVNWAKSDGHEIYVGFNAPCGELEFLVDEWEVHLIDTSIEEMLEDIKSGMKPNDLTEEALGYYYENLQQGFPRWE